MAWFWPSKAPFGSQRGAMKVLIPLSLSSRRDGGGDWWNSQGDDGEETDGNEEVFCHPRLLPLRNCCLTGSLELKLCLLAWS